MFHNSYDETWRQTAESNNSTFCVDYRVFRRYQRELSSSNPTPPLCGRPPSSSLSMCLWFEFRVAEAIPPCLSDRVMDAQRKAGDGGGNDRANTATGHTRQSMTLGGAFLFTAGFFYLLRPAEGEVSTFFALSSCLLSLFSFYTFCSTSVFLGVFSVCSSLRLSASCHLLGMDVRSE